MFKYSCRKCPIRNRCIDESANSPGAKIMVRKAFEARTDTLATWNLLQRNCLLLQAEQVRSSSALSDRLKEIRQTKEDDEVAEPEDTEQSKEPLFRRLRSLKPKRQKQEEATATISQPRDYLQPVSLPKEKQPVTPLKRLSSGGTGVNWLTVAGSKRHISLPATGPLSFGRFDPNMGIPPDIDLAYEDRNTHLISRRHAAIVGQEGTHTVEDLGSKVGVFLNGKKLGARPSDLLKPGDHIRLGRIRILYDMMPYRVLNGVKNRWVRHVLLITPTGRRVYINPPRSAIIGRSDPQVNFKPDIDLNLDGPVAHLVSRRHILLRWRNGQPHIEDLGSGFGTRLRGEVLPLGEAVPLKPGDHIWLAGCVLAYDIEL